MARCLPVELELYILKPATPPVSWTTGHRDAVFDRREPLKRFSLVDRAWTRVAQRQLFSFLLISVPLRTALPEAQERLKTIREKGWRVQAFEVVVPDAARTGEGEARNRREAARARRSGCLQQVDGRDEPATELGKATRNRLSALLSTAEARVRPRQQAQRVSVEDDIGDREPRSSSSHHNFVKHVGQDLLYVSTVDLVEAASPTPPSNASLDSPTRGMESAMER
ncbi:hypothetical protein JCM10213_008443 [Rhodosporidiobolus nylandii]